MWKDAVLGTAGIQRRVPATADQVPYLRAAVLAFFDDRVELDEDVRSAVGLAVTEACANAVVHAYPRRAGDVTVTAGLDERYLTVRVSDDGVGVDARPSARGLGLGIPLMRTLADARIRSDNGTTVLLRFPVPAARPA